MVVKKEYIKKVLPKGLWPFIRERLILRKHRKTVSMLEPIVAECMRERRNGCILGVKGKIIIPEDKKIIWQYWAQGFEDDKLPFVVKVCLSSVDKNASDYRIIRLSEATISDYLELPDWLEEKRKKMSIVHFSDMLRCMLLSVYGGLWLDVCTLLTGRIPNYISSHGYFMYQRDPEEPHKNYWKNTFAFYFGWNKDFRVNVLTGIMYAQKGDKAISDICFMLMDFWRKYDSIPDYFFFQIMIDIYIKRYPKRISPIVNDCIPHMLRQYLNEDASLPYAIDDILSMTTVHSLSNKSLVMDDNLKELIKKYNV